MSRYAVIDIETTGVSPAYQHRILEIAVALVDDSGNLVYEWDTLLNPQRDVGATEIHGLSAADVYLAPTFDQVAGDIESLLRGRVPVSHNWPFDALFIASEYERLGYPVSLGPTSGLCTMRLASRYLPHAPRALKACCECIGCQIEAAHTALGDVHAVARLLAHYIASDSDFLRAWSDVISTAQNSRWPGLSPQGASRLTRQSAAITKHEHFLSRLASRTPRSEIHPKANTYLAVLDRVLLDRHLSRHEEDELVSAAQMMGLSREDALGLHRLYLCALGKLAREDGIVTPKEREELGLVAELLGLSADDVEASLHPDAQVGGDVCEVGNFTLKPGDAVVFTGDAPGLDRADLEYQARSLGLRVSGSVSRRTSLVIAADPDSISGKARKARDLDVPIVNYATYLGMLDSVSCQHPT